MSAADPEHIAFARPAKLLFDVADTVDRIASNPLEWNSRGYAPAIILFASSGWSQSRYQGERMRL